MRGLALTGWGFALFLYLVLIVQQQITQKAIALAQDILNDRREEIGDV